MVRPGEGVANVAQVMQFCLIDKVLEISACNYWFHRQTTSFFLWIEDAIVVSKKHTGGVVIALGVLELG